MGTVLLAVLEKKRDFLAKVLTECLLLNQVHREESEMRRRTFFKAKVRKYRALSD